MPHDDDAPASSLPPDALLQFSWVLDDRLAVGAAPRSYQALARRGFTAALNLQEDEESGPAHGPVPRGFEVVRVPIRDGIVGGVPSVKQVALAADAIRDLLDGGRIVYVHCYAGVGRSPMACVAYLARYEGMTLAEAVEHILDRHAPSAPNADQLRAVDRYLADLATERDAGLRSR